MENFMDYVKAENQPNISEQPLEVSAMFFADVIARQARGMMRVENPEGVWNDPDVNARSNAFYRATLDSISLSADGNPPAFFPTLSSLISQRS